MASTPEHDTLICLFHHTDRAERTVQELLEIGIPESAITLIGRARQVADIDTGTASLEQINVPEADRKHLRDGLRAGGSIVAVSADSSMAGQIEDIFKEYSADKIDEKVLSPSDEDVLSRGVSIDASAFPTTITSESVELPPASRIIMMNPPVAETISGSTLRSSGSASDSYSGDAVEEILLMPEHIAAFTGSPDVISGQTLVLFEPTDLVEDTDLVEPMGEAAVSASDVDRFDPDAPIDNVRNPAADRLNDPLNRR